MQADNINHSIDDILEGLKACHADGLTCNGCLICSCNTCGLPDRAKHSNARQMFEAAQAAKAHLEKFPNGAVAQWVNKQSL